MRGRGLEIAGIAAAVLLGLAVGTGVYTFVYARGASYLTNDPAACANCHVMNEQYSAWMKGPHHAVAVCNDCHTPHNAAAKYLVKARNGFFHSFWFTVGGFPEPIRITDRNRRVTEETCIRCHQRMVHAILGTRGGAEPPSCIRCHRSVGHETR